MNYTSETFKNLYHNRLRKSEIKSRRQFVEFLENEKGIDEVVEEQIKILQARLHFPIKKGCDCTTGRIAKVLNGMIIQEIMDICVIESDSYLERQVAAGKESFEELNNDRYADELDWPPVAISVQRTPGKWGV